MEDLVRIITALWTGIDLNKIIHTLFLSDGVFYTWVLPVDQHTWAIRNCVAPSSQPRWSNSVYSGAKSLEGWDTRTLHQHPEFCDRYPCNQSGVRSNHSCTSSSCCPGPSDVKNEESKSCGDFLIRRIVCSSSLDPALYWDNDNLRSVIIASIRLVVLVSGSLNDITCTDQSYCPPGAGITDKIT